MGTIISSNKKEKVKSEKKSSSKIEPKKNEKKDQDIENLNPNFILVSTNDNAEQLPLKKRHRYEVTDLKEILNGNTYLVKSPSKKLSSPSRSPSRGPLGAALRATETGRPGHPRGVCSRPPDRRTATHRFCRRPGAALCNGWHWAP